MVLFGYLYLKKTGLTLGNNIFSKRIFSDKLVISPPWEAQEGDVIIEPGLPLGQVNIQQQHLVWSARRIWAELSRESDMSGSGLWFWYFGDGRSQIGIDGDWSGY